MDPELSREVDVDSYRKIRFDRAEQTKKVLGRSGRIVREGRDFLRRKNWRSLLQREARHSPHKLVSKGKIDSRTRLGEMRRLDYIGQVDLGD